MKCDGINHNIDIKCKNEATQFWVSTIDLTRHPRYWNIVKFCETHKLTENSYLYNIWTKITQCAAQQIQNKLDSSFKSIKEDTISIIEKDKEYLSKQ